MSSNRDSDDSWQTAYFLVLLFGVLIAVVGGIAISALGTAEPRQAFGFAIGIVGITTLVLVMISLVNESCFGVVLAGGFGLVVFVILVLASLEGQGSWNWYQPR